MSLFHPRKWTYVYQLYSSRFLGDPIRCGFARFRFCGDVAEEWTLYGEIDGDWLQLSSARYEILKKKMYGDGENWVLPVDAG